MKQLMKTYVSISVAKPARRGSDLHVVFLLLNPCSAEVTRCEFIWGYVPNCFWPGRKLLLSMLGFLPAPGNTFI